MIEYEADWPVATPDCLTFVPSGGAGWQEAGMAQLQQQWGGKVEAARITLVDADDPLPPYPAGLYFEGWSVAPQRLEPPHRAGPFAYPI